MIMGTKLTFKCNNCGYWVTTSGGPDYGMVAVTETFICKSCKNIVDICVGAYGKTYTREEILQKKKGSDSGLDFYTCPECGSGEKLVKWDETIKPCPRCDGKMEQDINSVIISWD
jgi:ribosomal protein L37AE/L43A